MTLYDDALIIKHRVAQSHLTLQPPL